MRNYLDTCRNEGFDSSVIIAKEIATKIDVELSFPVKLRTPRKKQFDEIDHLRTKIEKDFEVN